VIGAGILTWLGSLALIVWRIHHVNRHREV
jgi:hypothetical protein